MPYRLEYFPAPKNPELTVYVELPPEYAASHVKYHQATLKPEHWEQQKSLAMHYCDNCGGWIEGEANAYRVNTLSRLSGRRGTEYYCRRCGELVYFTGVLS